MATVPPPTDSRYALMALDSTAISGSIDAIVAMLTTLVDELSASAGRDEQDSVVVMSAILSKAKSVRTAAASLDIDLQANAGNIDGRASHIE